MCVPFAPYLQTRLDHHCMRVSWDSKRRLLGTGNGGRQLATYDVWARRRFRHVKRPVRSKSASYPINFYLDVLRAHVGRFARRREESPKAGERST